MITHVPIVEEEHAKIVFWAAKHAARRYPEYARGELVFFGWKGLRRAVQKFRPEAGWKFSTFASRVIDREISGSVRREREARKRRATACEWLDQIAVDVPGGADRLEVEDLLSRLGNADRELYRLLYLDGLTQADVARLHGVSESAISQRVQAMIRRCRGVWEVEHREAVDHRVGLFPEAVPCVDCGTSGGLIPAGRRTPVRHRGRCRRCHNKVLWAAKKKAIEKLRQAVGAA